MNAGTILVVDDKPENIRLLFEALNEGGYRTLAAVNGQGAVHQAELAGPDLILLDVMMPGMDGFETCRRLKELPTTRDIPVIFVTALAETTDKLKGFEAGGVDYLTKPLQHEEVLARVRAHLWRERLWREVDLYSQLLLKVGAADTLADAWSALLPLVETQPKLAGMAIWEHTENEKELRLSGQLGFFENGPEQWKSPAGHYVRVSLDDDWLGKVVESGLQESAANSTEWTPYPKWAGVQGFDGYIASPVVCRNEGYGVLLAVYKMEVDEEVFEEHRHWQSILAGSLGNAVFQTRSLEAIRNLSEQLRHENEGLRAEITGVEPPEGFVGQSPAFRRILDEADRVAYTDAAVLIQGESGTGKEVLAQWIHQRSPRSESPLIRVNCAAIPSELFESEFFGHVKGAFTGAVQDRIGRFQLAHQGSLFLDEVGEIPLALQGKLLRVLQEGTFERVGENQPRETDVRIIAATNRELREEVRRGAFREDLYYRLSVFPIFMPPLRDRIEDVPELVRLFAARYARKMGFRSAEISQNCIDPLLSYSWPGNIRELQNEVERTLILNRGVPKRFTAPFGSSHDSQNRAASADDPVWTEEEWRELYRANIHRAMEQSGWQVDGPGGAAERLKVRPTTLRSRIKSLGLNKNE